MVTTKAVQEPDGIVRTRLSVVIVALGWTAALLTGCSSGKASRAQAGTTTTSTLAVPAATGTVATGGSTTSSPSVPATTLAPAITSPAPPGATTVPTTPPGPPAGVARLRILLPRPGDVVQAPFAVQFQITDFAVGPSQGGLRLTLGDGGAFALSLRVDSPSGVDYLNDNRLSGRRTLVFTLVTANQQTLTNPEATVTVAGVTIEGGK